MKKSELIKKTKQELMELARKAGLPGRSKMNKDGLASSLSKLLKAERVSIKKGEKRVPAKKKKEPLMARPIEKVELWQEKVEEAKYYLGEGKAFFTEEELPEGYGDNRIVLMVRDPYWAYAYWEINNKKIEEARRELKSELDRSRLVLRVYDITDIDFNGTNAHSFFDIDIPNILGNWYVNLGMPNRTFCIDIGYRKPDGGLFILSRSNKITSPRERPSEIVDKEWMRVGEEYIQEFVRSGASPELAEIMKRRMEGWIASPGIKGKPIIKH